MPSLVAIVETRPETVRADYGRVLDLAGMTPSKNSPLPVFLSQNSGSPFQPGFDSPVWQIDAVLDLWAKQNEAEFRGRILPLGKSGPDPSSSLPQGHPVWLLPVPELNGKWQVSGCMALLARLLPENLNNSTMDSPAEKIADSLAQTLTFTGAVNAVMDATSWGVHRQDGKPHAMIRNVLLAGNDPLAVDAVAAQLAGVDPRRVEWMQLVQARGLGVADPDKIQIKGRKDLLSLDFEMPEGTFGTGRAAGSIWSWPGRVLGALGRKKMDTSFGNSAWGRLLVEYEQEK